MNMDSLKKEFLPKYLKVGEQKFYNFLLTYALNKLANIDKESYKGTYPDIEFLGYYDKFVILYRRENEEAYMEIAKIFRRASHKIHRIMLKNKMTESNSKFLRAV